MDYKITNAILDELDEFNRLHNRKPDLISLGSKAWRYLRDETPQTSKVDDKADWEFAGVRICEDHNLEYHSISLTVNTTLGMDMPILDN